MNNGKRKTDDQQEEKDHHNIYEETRKHKVVREMHRKLPGTLSEMSGHVQRRREIEALRGEDDLWRLIEGPLLKPREREALKLKMLEDLSHDEIAQKLLCSERTAQRLYEKAIRKIADAILY